MSIKPQPPPLFKGGGGKASGQTMLLVDVVNLSNAHTSLIRKPANSGSIGI